MRHDTTLLVSLLTLVAVPLRAADRPCDAPGPLPVLGGADCAVADDPAPGPLTGHAGSDHATLWDTWTGGPPARLAFEVGRPHRVLPRWDFTGRIRPEAGLVLAGDGGDAWQDPSSTSVPLVAEPFSVVGRIVEEPPTAVVPEPATMTLVGSGLVGLAAARRRRKAAAARDGFAN